MSFARETSLHNFENMNTINGLDAIRLLQEVSKIPDGSFTLAFYPYNRTKGEASARLKTFEGCKTRAQLPQEKWSIGSDNYFLFQDKDGNPKTCYRVLIRFIGLPNDGFQLRRVTWLNTDNE